MGLGRGACGLRGASGLEAWGAVELEAWSLELKAVWSLGLALGAYGGSRGSKRLGFMAIRPNKEASKIENCHFGM